MLCFDASSDQDSVAYLNEIIEELRTISHPHFQVSGFLSESTGVVSWTTKMAAKLNNWQLLLLAFLPIMLAAQAQSADELAGSDVFTELWMDGHRWYALAQMASSSFGTFAMYLFCAFQHLQMQP
jgi:hypothetical protein